MQAAQCFAVSGRNATNIAVVVGTMYINSTGTDNGTVYSVASIKSHPNYDGVTKVNDIALVKTNVQITFGSYVYPIALQNLTIAAGTTAVLTGWGATSYPSSAYPNTLQTVKLNIISNVICASVLVGLTNLLTNTQLCTYSDTGHGACTGDR